VARPSACVYRNSTSKRHGRREYSYYECYGHRQRFGCDQPLFRQAELEAEVLRLLVQGLAREEIARRLGVTPRVVVADIGVIYRAFALDESGLTPAQRRLELRRIVAVLRKLEREEAPPPPPPAAPASEPAAAERPTPLVLLPPPIPTPPASFSAWRWWPVAAALLLLAIVAGTWWVTHGAGQRALAGTTAISTTVTTPAVVVAAANDHAHRRPIANTDPPATSIYSDATTKTYAVANRHGDGQSRCHTAEPGRQGRVQTPRHPPPPGPAGGLHHRPAGQTV